MAGELATLITDPIALAKLQRGVIAAVERSFIEDKSRVTQDETRRRFNFCVSIFRELRNAPFLWSVDRIVDSLGPALRHKLDNTPWDPTNARTIWTPNAPGIVR